jgi:cell shape-determining protein MreC
MVLALLFVAKELVARVAMVAVSPFVYARHYIETSTAALPVFIRSRLELLQEIQTLEQKVAASQDVEETLNILEKENAELRSLMHSSSTPQILAGVIARPPYTPYDTLVIDRGYDDGVYENAPVFYSDHKILGYVSKSFPKTALITLLSSSGVESTVYIFGPNVFTTAYGEGGGVIRMSVPQGILLEKENIVVTPSLENGILGAIDEIQSIPTEPEQHAYVTFDIPLQSLRLVSVGTRSVQEVDFETARAHVEDVHTRLFFVDVPPEARIEVPEVGSTTNAADVASTTATSTSSL